MRVSILLKNVQIRSVLIAGRFRCVMAALILSGLAGGAEAQRPDQDLQVGRWTISNLGRQASGSACMATTAFNDGGVIGVMSEGSFAELVIGQSGLRTTHGTRYDVAYSFDGGRWIRASGEGGRNNMMTIPMSGSVDASLRDFADMDEIDLQLPNNITVNRSLSGSGAAITALRRCIRN